VKELSTAALNRNKDTETKAETKLRLRKKKLEKLDLFISPS